MSENSKIEWTDHTFNPWWGCVRVSPGCQHCYAESFAKRVGQDVWGPEASRRYFGAKHWAEPVKWNATAQRAGVRARVFCASMADVFERHPNCDENENLQNERIKLWRLIESTPWLDWLLLTKRPENVMEMVPGYGSWSWLGGFPPNVWMLTTAEDQERANVRVPILLRIPAAVRGLSIEPLLGPILLDNGEASWLTCSERCSTEEGCMSYMDDGECFHGIDWVIVGGESGHGARPMHPDWARSLRDQCVAAGVPFFFKQWGEYVQRIGFKVDPTGFVVDTDGEPSKHFGPTEYFARVGKKAAGRLLDGRTWDEFPSSSPSTASEVERV